MLNTLHLKERLGFVPVAYDGTLSAGANYSKGFCNRLAVSGFEEAVLVLYLADWSTSVTGEKITVEVQDADENTGSKYGTPDYPLAQVFGPTAQGGGGEVLPGGVLAFHFNPGQFKPWVRFKVTNTTAGGTATIDYTAILLLGGARNEPVEQPDASTVLVTSV